MSPDFRYHVTSLAAVFLALGIGILIGTAFVGAPFVDRQNRLITRLDTRVTDLRRELRERDQTEAALTALLPRLTRNKLKGASVVVLQLGRSAESVEAAEAALQECGAVAYRLTLPEDAWWALSEVLRSERAGRLGDALAQRDSDALLELQRSGLLKGTLPSPTRPYKVVLAGGERADGAKGESPTLALAQSRDLPLLAKLVENGARVVAAEPYEADPSLVPIWQSERVATVDCVNRAAGHLALIGALRGELGRYGMKPGADRLLPESVTREQVVAPKAKAVAAPKAKPTTSPVPAPTP